MALTTLLINYSVLLTSHPSSASASRVLTLLPHLSNLITTQTTPSGGAATPDSESTYRALVALGTLLTLSAGNGGNEVKEAAREVYDLRDVVLKAKTKFEREERVKNVVSEVMSLLS